MMQVTRVLSPVEADLIFVSRVFGSRVKYWYIHNVPITPPPHPHQQPFFRAFKKSTAPYKVHNMGLRYIITINVSVVFMAPFVMVLISAT